MISSDARARRARKSCRPGLIFSRSLDRVARCPQTKSELVRAVERARAVDAYISVYGLRLRQIADRVPLPYDQATIAEGADRPLSNQELCTPISGDVPPNTAIRPLSARFKLLASLPSAFGDQGQPNGWSMLAGGWVKNFGPLSVMCQQSSIRTPNLPGM